MDSARLDTLLHDVKSRRGSFDPSFKAIWRDIALARAAKPERSLGQLRAGTVCELAKCVPIFINPGWTLAGEHLTTGWAAPFAQQSIQDAATLKAELDAVGATDELEKVRATFAHYNSRNSALAPGEVNPAWKTGSCGWGTSGTAHVFMAGGWTENHSIRDYAKLLRIGFQGLAREIDAELASHAITEPDYAAREGFLNAARAICDAGVALGSRYAERAFALAAKAVTEQEKARLLEIAHTCSRVPAEGARSFKEAVQSLWFGHLITCAEDGINANSIGRLDQILAPYYLRDCADGVITRETAVDLMTEFAAKLYLDYDVQAITIGGVDANGNCAVNELSYIILDATERFGQIRDLSARVDSRTPDQFIKACCKMVLRGGGIPFFFNDESFIPALVKRGVKLEDARDYAPIGCVELTIPGKTNPHAVSGWFNLLKCLELAIHGGIDPASGVQLGPTGGSLESFNNFEELMTAFQRQVRFFADRMVYNCRRGEAMQREFGPLPGWSLLTDNCIKRGRDITNGGAVYNYHSICLMGVPDTADALASLKSLLFEKGTVKAAEVMQALKADFKGYESLRRQLLNDAPKYGNGDGMVDDLAAGLSADFIALMDSYSVPENKFLVHLFTFMLNIDFGRKVGAMPDGRLAQEPLAYSLSAHQGRDAQGVTSMLRSLARQPHADAAAGSAAIIDLHPSVFERCDGVEMLTTLLKSALKMGVGQLQWNVVSVEQLRQAKAEPEKYGNIPVRVAGYSQAFKLIEESLQDHIIARHKHGRL